MASLNTDVDNFDVFAEQANTVIGGSYSLYDTYHLTYVSSAFIEEESIESLNDTFNRLKSQWKEETINSSSYEDIVANTNYKEIIKLGQLVVPLMLTSLKETPDFWFSALSEITKANPVIDADAGHMKKMTAAWLKWGAKNGQV